MKRQQWRKSVFKQLVVSFVLILIPLYWLSAVVYQHGMKTLRDEFTQSMVSQVAYHTQTLERDVRRISTLEYDLINDQDINRLASIPGSLDNIGRMESLLRIQNRLIAIQNSSKYIESIEVLIQAADRTISQNGISEWDGERFERLRALAQVYENRMQVIDGELHLVVAYPYLALTGRPPLYILDIQLSRKSILEGMKTLRGSPAEGVVFRRPEDEYVIRDVAAEPEEEPDAILNMLPAEPEMMAREVEVNGKRYLAVRGELPFFDASLVKYVPESSVFQAVQRYTIWFAMLPISAVVIVIIYSLYLRRFIHTPLSKLVNSFGRVRGGDFTIHIEHGKEDEFGYIYGGFNDMVRDLGSLIEQNVRQKMLVQRAEMKQLQSQINPHFLYNSFFILNTLARTGDIENLQRLTDQLGRYFKHVTRNAADVISLEKEVEHAATYAGIQQMRFGNRIQVKIAELPAACAKILVPRLILQPLVENAFEHGLADIRSDGLLQVVFEHADGLLSIIVRNNGSTETAEACRRLNDLLARRLAEQEVPVSAMTEEVTALQNIHLRLRLMFGAPAGLELVCGPGDRFQAVMRLPDASTVQEEQTPTDATRRLVVNPDSGTSPNPEEGSASGQSPIP